jgi:cation:H+ antiporter
VTDGPGQGTSVCAMLLSIALLVVGLVVLIRASDQLVLGSARLATVLRLSSVVIGVVVIGFGTSAPELLVTGLAAAEGLFDLGVGNIIGSNVANVLLVLGAAAIIGPITVGRGLRTREVPISLATVLMFAWAIQGRLRVIEGILLSAALVIALVAVIILSRDDDELLPDEIGPLRREDIALGRESVRTLLGLLFTVAGAQMVVTGAGSIAAQFGIDEGFVGLTLVAVGTSLPELAASIQAVRRAESGLLIGNLLGSNLFNATAVGAVIVWSGAALDQTVGPALTGPATLVMVGAVGVVSLLLVLRDTLRRGVGIALVAGYFVAMGVLAL